MSNTATIAVRVEPKIKERANQVVEGLGLDLSTALRLFVNQIVLQNRVPVELKYPAVSSENAQSMMEGEIFFEQSTKSRFKDSAEMFDALGV